MLPTENAGIWQKEKPDTTKQKKILTQNENAMTKN